MQFYTKVGFGFDTSARQAYLIWIHLKERHSKVI